MRNDRGLAKYAYRFYYQIDIPERQISIEKIMSEISTRRSGVNDAPVVVRTDLAALLSDYTNSQRRCMYKEQSISRAMRTSYLSLDNNRLESLEREMVSLKGQVNQVYTPMEEHELNRTFTTKKAPGSQPTSARVSSPSRIPLPITPRKSSADDRSAVSANGNTSMPRPLPTAPLMSRSKTFHNNPSSSPPSNFSDEANLLRAYKMHLEQTLHKDNRVPNYTSLEDVIRANEVFSFVRVRVITLLLLVFSNFFWKMIVFDRN